jgi:membrane protein YqaA with SNARE-associated domain
VIGNLIFYFMAKYTSLKLFRKDEAELDDSHFLQKHRNWVFILAPLFFVTGDSIMIWAGAKKMPIHRFVIPMIIGNAIRVVIYLLSAMGLLTFVSKIFG